MNPAQVIEADLTWTGHRFEPGIRIEVGPDGRIVRVGDLDVAPTRRLRGQAIVPGLVNAHSHAFQRGLRGHDERFPHGPGSFRTWRTAMYAFAERLGHEEFAALSAQAFREMRAGGVTTVGEFHYLHHSTGTHDFAYDRLVLDAARAAGIRIALLVGFYRTGGIGKTLSPAQRRFDTIAPDAYWTHLDHLATHLDQTQSLGAVVHSIRATSLADLGTIHARSVRRGLPFHIHLEEQRHEIEECIEAYGRTPTRVLLDTIESAQNVTGVHCTHTTTADRQGFLASGGRICACPLTEANLGDGLPALDDVPHGRLCLGTDSNARIDMTEEMRWLEYGQRLRRQERGALTSPKGEAALTLLAAATTGGAASLGLDAGTISPGTWADFATLDLGNRALAGATPETLLESWIFGADGHVIGATCVGGSWQDHHAV